MIAPAVPVYSDFQSLQQLKTAARSQPEDTLLEVAKQFEAVFLQMMLKNMRSASLAGDSLLDSDQSLFYRDLFDQQIALTLAEGGQVGLARILVQQLGGSGIAASPVARLAEPTASSGVNAPGGSISAPPVPQPANPATPAQRTPPPPEAPQNSTPLAATVQRSEPSSMPESAATQAGRRFSSPEDFVQSMWPHAEAAARRLGQSPEVLIAQAALETGWGKSVPRAASGATSHNLFGIKADSRWHGQRVVNTTLEFIDGLPQKRRDGFRAYESYAESFNDYANFLQRNQRYRKALGLRDDGMGFIKAIHQAGYATDPNYSAKIERILNGPVMDRAISALQVAGHTRSASL